MNFFTGKQTLVLVVVSLAAFLAAPAMATSDSNVDVVLIDVGKAGASASIDVNVSPMTQIYPREVVLLIRPQKNNWKDKAGTLLDTKFDELMESLTGIKLLHYPGDIPHKSHKDVQVHVTWVEKGTGRILKERDVIADNGQSKVRIGFGASFGLDSMLLPSGHYVVTVRAINNDERFDGTFETGLFSGYTWK
jgi:hypothetical protein